MLVSFLLQRNIENLFTSANKSRAEPAWRAGGCMICPPTLSEVASGGLHLWPRPGVAAVLVPGVKVRGQTPAAAGTNLSGGSGAASVAMSQRR